MRARPVAAVAALVLAAGVATGCADTGDRYCDTVADQQDRLGEIADSGDDLAVLDAREVYAELAQDAPDDIRDEWRLVIDRIDAFARVLEETGVDPESLDGETYDPQDPPDDLDARDRARLRQAADDLVAIDVVTAQGDLEQQALDVCGTPLRSAGTAQVQVQLPPLHRI